MSGIPNGVQASDLVGVVAPRVAVAGTLLLKGALDGEERFLEMAASQVAHFGEEDMMVLPLLLAHVAADLARMLSEGLGVSPSEVIARAMGAL